MSTSRFERWLRYKRWWSKHCEQGMSLRQICKQEGYDHASTVLRGIRVIENSIDEPLAYLTVKERKKRRVKENLIVSYGGSTKLKHLHEHALISDFHVTTAKRFIADPDAWKKAVAPSVFNFLHLVLINDISLETIEKRLSLPARSAKAVLRMFLTIIEETPNPEPTARTPPEQEVENLRAALTYITEPDPDHIEFIIKYCFTHNEAVVFSVLLRRERQVVTKEALHRHLYGLQHSDAQPLLKTVDTYISRLRMKLADSNYHIETSWGVGYCLIDTAKQKKVAYA